MLSRNQIRSAFYESLRLYRICYHPTRDTVMRIFGARLDWILSDPYLAKLLDRRDDGLYYIDLGVLEDLAVPQAYAAQSDKPYSSEAPAIEDMYWHWGCFLEDVR